MAELRDPYEDFEPALVTSDVEKPVEMFWSCHRDNAVQMLSKE